jgi:hypothetical protein
MYYTSSFPLIPARPAHHTGCRLDLETITPHTSFMSFHQIPTFNLCFLRCRSQKTVISYRFRLGTSAASVISRSLIKETYGLRLFGFNGLTVLAVGGVEVDLEVDVDASALLFVSYAP